jgi:hypothetical protein
MKQTAVDFIINEFSEILGLLETKPMQDILMIDAMKRAKEMEKEQIEDAYFIGGRDSQINRYRGMHEYYEQTYGGKDGK